MIRLNLLPYRQQRREKQLLRFMAMLVLAILLSIAAALTWSLSLQASYDEKEQVFNALLTENAGLEHQKGVLAGLPAKRALVEKKLAMVERVRQGKSDLYTALIDVAKVIPENVWLSKLNVDARSVGVSAYAESNQAISHFMEQLDALPRFDHIRLEGIKRVQLQGVLVKKFSLQLQKHHPENKKGAAP